MVVIVISQHKLSNFTKFVLQQVILDGMPMTMLSSQQFYKSDNVAHAQF